MTQLSDGIAAGGTTISLLALGRGYYELAIAGAIIGGIAWFSGRTRADPKWRRDEEVSHGMRYVLFGLITFPAAVSITDAMLPRWGIHSPALEIMAGGFAAFAITELYPAAVAGLKNFFRNIGGRNG